MTWFKKALEFFKDIQPQSTKPFVEAGEKLVEGVPGFAKLTGEMIEAAGVNIEQGIAKGFRAITGKSNFLPAHNTMEGPLKSSVSLQDLAHFSQGAYDDKGGGPREGYDIITTRQVDDLSFSIYQNSSDGHVVVSFRGTNSFENWSKRNLDFHTVDDGFGNSVHGGFKGAWDELKPVVDHELYDLLGSHTLTNNVTFTGHSLGGAIAQLAGADYSANQNPRLVDTVTFAAPVVGDQGFLDRIPGGHMMNVVDPRDSVPKIVQLLQPKFVEPELTTRIIAVGDKAARTNDRVKKDAIKFGIDIAFDAGIVMLMVYGGEFFEAGAEAGPEVGEAIVEEGLAIEEGLVGAAEKAAGVGIEAEEGALLEAIGGGGESFSTAERADIGLLFNAESRASVMEQLSNIDIPALLENAIKDKVGAIDWEQTLQKAMLAEGMKQGAVNLITPFVMHNVEGLETVDPDKIHFLLQNSYEFMYGAAAAHPMGQYIKNIDTRFGDNRINARDDMWQNYLKKLDPSNKELEGLLQFMTEEELAQFQEEFAHAVETAEEVDDDEEDEEDQDDPVDMPTGTREETRVDPHNLAGHEANEISGRPLQVLTEGLGRKADGGRIFSVITEDGDVLSYNGPKHTGSTTTLFGKWTGVAPFADDFPVKVSRQNAFGGQSFSALDTFSLAYLVNSYTNGYHNDEADKIYQKRINAAIENGFISESIDGEELRVAKQILQEFNERGHLFAVDTGKEVKGNLLTEIDVASRGAIANLGDDVNGVPIAFTQNRKRKISEMFTTREGTGVARDIMHRDSKRIKSSETDDVNLIENGMGTIEFNLRALRSLGMENSPEYAMLLNAAKQASLGYKTALNVEGKLSELVQNVQRVTDSGAFDTEGPGGIFPNVLGQYTTRDVKIQDDSNISGNAEYFRDIAVREILKKIV